ncbi:MAG: (d)CMP kinase [Oscillospiraceae bacterium]
MNDFISIAIDGPSGAGKSTIAKALAKKRGYVYVDTGAIYRTVGYAAQEAGLDSRDKEGIIALLPGLHIDIAYDESGTQRMLLNGRDVSREIRTPKSSLYASDVSALPEVRAFLMEMQRSLARRNHVIMDGRDIGTVVLPDARVKIFLTAADSARAERRWRELREKGSQVSYEEVLRDIRYRDEQDSGRAAAPLRAAEDAVTVDTTGLSFEESVDAVEQVIREKLER